MKQSVLWQLALSSVILATGCQSTSTETTSQTSSVSSPSVTAPIAAKVPYKTKIHGYELVDNYHWLRDDSRSSEQVIAHLEKENSYTDTILAPSEALQAQLFSEIKAKIVKDNRSVPVQKGRYFYFNETIGDQEYASIYRSLTVDGVNPELLLDINELAKAHEFYELGDIEVSPNANLLAYTEDTLSRRIYTVKVKNLTTGEILKDELKGVQDGVVWANDNQTLYYIKKDPVSLLGTQVYRHTLGTAQEQDELVYEEADNTYYTYLSRSKDGEQIFIYHYSTESKGMSVLSADDAKAKPQRLLAREKGLEYSVSKHKDWYYILTNLNAVNFKLMKAKIDAVSDKANWQTVIEHQPNVRLEDFTLFDEHLVYQSRAQGQSKITIRELKKNKEHQIEFNDPAYRVSMIGNNTLSSDSVRVQYASMTTPKTTFEVDLNDYSKVTLKQDKVLGDFNSADYQSERIFVTARDGVKVPVSIVYKKSLFKKDGTNPLLQYGYGSYGYTVDPGFSISRLSLLDRGFVYAIAHIRGSQMLGRPWYEDGKKLNKKNTFNDFVDVTKALVAQGYGDKKRVYAQGGSAGGLLMGAVVNQAPELYHGVHAAVPFVDVINTMLDESLPLTTNEYDEWGNPNDKAYFDYMRSYSPYDQVSAQAYPNMLVTTGLHDSQVQYFEPAKWVAKLREKKTDNNKLLLKVDMEAGHGGASGRFKSIKDTALNYAFFIELANGRL
ncbi:S9 family peptidase [Pseudoalteromonas sp. S16_S37]|uniref:S9 family peptidase n=1 Tax=Pseudoalteromonas sp. S16_S37 TaxID=2720228 RepID=UPI001680EECE|nr:S9 family peptidase [Pseudoalteromonas sp. S16_S37]MBD1582626.1 S9 family peptidase [Pseudoalteromonas sp. S16_S37]